MLCHSNIKSYFVGTYYNQRVHKILICNHRNSFYEEMCKELSDSFYCMPFLLNDRFTKDSSDSAGKKKQLTITYCEERSSGRLRNFSEMINMIFSQLCKKVVSLTTNIQQNFFII